MNRTQAFIGGLVLVVGTSAITSAVIPQDNAGGDPWDLYCVPGPEHDMLEHLAGRWALEVTATIVEGDEPVQATLTSDYRWLFGGRFLRGEYDGYVMGELFQAKELLGYDNYRRQYNSIWIDNMTTAFTHGMGYYDARQEALILEGVQDDVERGVRDEKFRFIYRFEDADNMTIELWRPDQGGKMFQAAKIAATRID